MKEVFFILLMTVCALALASCGPGETTSPVRKSITDAVFATGFIEQKNSYVVSSQVDGIITSLPVGEGDSVSGSDIIATVENDVQREQLQDALNVHNDALKSVSPESPQLQQAQAQVDKAREQLRFDEENYLRYKALWEKNAVAKLDFQKAENQFITSQKNLNALQRSYDDTKRQLDLGVERSRVSVNTQRTLLGEYMMIAHESGVVTNLFKTKGELIRRGEAIAKIGSGRHIIRLFVSEEDITMVETGQVVAVHMNIYPDQTFTGRVTRIYPAFDETEQSYIAEAEFEQMPGKILTGTQLQANIQISQRSGVLVIPTGYVTQGSMVVLASGEKVQISTGSKDNTWTEVISGITEQDVIRKPGKEG